MTKDNIEYEEASDSEEAALEKESTIIPTLSQEHVAKGPLTIHAFKRIPRNGLGEEISCLRKELEKIQDRKNRLLQLELLNKEENKISAILKDCNKSAQ